MLDGKERIPAASDDTGVIDSNTSLPSEGQADMQAKVTELESTLAGMREQQQKQSAYFGKLDNRLGQLDKLLERDGGSNATPTPEPQQVPPVSNEMQSLAKQFEILKAQQGQQAEVATRQSITAALQSFGVDAATAKQGAKWIALEQGDLISADYVDGDITVRHGADDIRSYISGFLETPAGKLLKPSQVGPTPNSGNRGNAFAPPPAGKQQISSMDYSQLVANTPREDRRALADKYDIIG